MPSVDLTVQEWQTLITLIGNNVAWAQANPLLMKIGAQLREKPDHGSDGRFMPREEKPKEKRQ